MNNNTDSYRINSDIITKKMRLDRFISEQLPDFSRQRIQTLIKNGYVVDQENNPITNPATKVISNHEYIITIPPPEPTDIQPNPSIPIDVIFEDDDLIVLNKAPGITVHPGAGNYNDTLVNGLIHYCKDSLSSVGGVERPGIVHRLDKDTSGLMMIAKNDKTHHSLTEQLATRNLSRKYLCLCWNHIIPRSGIIHTQIGRHSKNRKLMSVVADGQGKEAITHYETKELFLNNSICLIECSLKTGRTHQIRVHMSHSGCSIIGDQSYGRNPINKYKKLITQPIYDYIHSLDRQMLHAYHICFNHPTHNKLMEFSAPPPVDMEQLIKLLQN